MMRCMTSAISGLKAHQTAMDVVGNNISNINTYGFKSSSTSFRDTMYQEISAPTASDTASGIAGTNPAQIGFGATTSGISVDNSDGAQDATGKGMDCYINGQGYFIVGNGKLTADGSNAELMTPASYKYTRVGSLSFKNGYLTDGNGNFICGQQNPNFGTDKKIKTDTTWTPVSDYKSVTPQAIHYEVQAKDKDGNITGDKLDNFKIGADGTITATNADGKTVTIGQIGVANFPSAEGLEAAGDSYYTSNTSSGDAAYSTPGTNASGALKTGALEASNVDLATELSNMIIYERGYQANTKIITAADEMLQTLVNMK